MEKHLIKLGFVQKGLYWERTTHEGVFLRYQNGKFYNYSHGKIGRV